MDGWVRDSRKLEQSIILKWSVRDQKETPNRVGPNRPPFLRNFPSPFLSRKISFLKMKTMDYQTIDLKDDVIVFPGKLYLVSAPSSQPSTRQVGKQGHLEHKTCFTPVLRVVGELMNGLLLSTLKARWVSFLKTKNEWTGHPSPTNLRHDNLHRHTLRVWEKS